MELLGADGGDGLREFIADIGSHQTHPLLEGWLSKLDSCEPTSRDLEILVAPR